MMRTLAALALLSLPAAALADASALPDVALTRSDGTTVRLAAVVSAHRATVVEMFSTGCPVQRAHDARLEKLFEAWRGEGVALLAVDPEPSVTREALAAEAKARGFRFPLLLDPGGKLARTLGARFCATAVVIDARGRVRYMGGIDGDSARLHDDARPWLRDAVAAVLAGREPDPARTESRGCYLQRW